MSPFKPVFAILTAAAALVIIGAVVFLYVKNTGAPAADATQEAVTTPTDTATATPAGTSSNTSPYKDGTYTAQSTYRTPETTEPLTVTLTLQNGIVTDANVVGDPQAPETVRYQGMFIANYKPLVIGKSIDSLSLTHVSGSSLTSSGFNAAVAEIKAQASA